jgi:hypothetical protein
MKALLIVFLLAVLALPAIAQPPNNADLESIRIGFITNKLNLTADQAKVFWPVYDAYRAEMKTVRDDSRDNVQGAKENFDTMSDKEVETAVDRMLDNRRKELDITLRYHEQFKKVINIRQIAKLYKAEHEFTQLLLQRLQQRQQQRMNGGAPGGPGGGGPAGGRRFQR